MRKKIYELSLGEELTNQLLRILDEEDLKVFEIENSNLEEQLDQIQTDEGYFSSEEESQNSNSENNNECNSCNYVFVINK